MKTTKPEIGSRWTRLSTKYVWAVTGHNWNGTVEIKMENFPEQTEHHEAGNLRACFREIPPENPMAGVHSEALRPVCRPSKHHRPR